VTSGDENYRTGLFPGPLSDLLQLLLTNLFEMMDDEEDALEQANLAEMTESSGTVSTSGARLYIFEVHSIPYGAILPFLLMLILSVYVLDRPERRHDLRHFEAYVCRGSMVPNVSRCAS